MSGEASSAVASSRCSWVARWSYSVPQCIDSTTMSAPACFARCAAARIVGTSVRLASHGCPAGTGMPLKPKEYASWPTLTPLGMVMISGVAASAAVRALPVCLRPAASNSSRVRLTPV